MNSLSVLVVEPDGMLAHMIGDVLRQSSHRPVVVSDGDAAVRLLSTQQFDVLLTEIVVPGSDGLEIMSVMRAAHPNARIIAMSGGGPYMKYGLCFELASYIAQAVPLLKPFSRQDVVLAVEGLRSSRLGMAHPASN